MLPRDDAWNFYRRYAGRRKEARRRGFRGAAQYPVAWSARLLQDRFVTADASQNPSASQLQAKLRAGDFVVTAELTPQVATEAGALLDRARQLKGIATAINLTDGAGAKTHLSSLVAAHLVLQS